MVLSEFKQNIVFVPKDEAKIIRYQYINNFIDKGKDYYKKYIEITHNFSDGIAYEGYLWDCLKEPIVTDIDYVEYFKKRISNVYVFWDIHSKERIFIKDYWKFGKDTVLKLDFQLLIRNLEYLPEDIYIFDENYSWTFVITHEYIDNKRWCLKTGCI